MSLYEVFFNNNGLVIQWLSIGDRGFKKKKNYVSLFITGNFYYNFKIFKHAIVLMEEQL